MSAPTIATGQAFQFTPENRALAERIIARYPTGRQHSAIIPLLDVAQRQNGGWLSHEAIAYVA
jgi:NADH:ubiquinone oxidoreductase subunit E